MKPVIIGVDMWMSMAGGIISRQIKVKDQQKKQK